MLGKDVSSLLFLRRLIVPLTPEHPITRPFSTTHGDLFFKESKQLSLLSSSFRVSGSKLPLLSSSLRIFQDNVINFVFSTEECVFLIVLSKLVVSWIDV